MTFDFHEDALEEYKQAGLWYKKRRLVLGLEFVNAIEQAIANILENPGRYRPAGKGVHIFRVKRFPYYVYYKLYQDPAHVRVVAVAHHKQRPDYWRNRLGEPAE